ncbi:MAG: GAF domain-containing protein [Anaerolineae bacterium]|nr:GAF domain-containing protein [Anaerolineae bacterium]
MTQQKDPVVVEYSESLANLETQVTQLGDVVSRTLQALSKHGVQLSVDLNAMIRDLGQDVGAVSKKSQKVLLQYDQQRELVDTVALITSSLELDDVLNEVMDTVIKLTGAERAYLMLRQRGGDELKIRAARNWDRETISDGDAVFSGSIVDLALEQQEPVVTTNAQGDARFQDMKSVVQHGLRSILCIPLLLHGRVVGVLYADNRIEQGLFSNDDVPLLTAFGTQAAIAIENARNYGKVKEDLRETQRELQHLKIQIDSGQVREQVSEITESEYFERLSETARALREARQETRDL